MKYIGILGHGTVGSGVYDMLVENKAEMSEACGEEVAVKRVLDMRSFKGRPAGLFTKNIGDILSDPDIFIVVECLGGVSPAGEWLLAAMDAGKHVVTSNKELVVAMGEKLSARAAEKNVGFLCEASVGGGIPILRPLKQCLAADRIIGIMGILNGTTNYILSRMASDKAHYPAALAEAQSLGYAEANPEADVEGHDSRRKLSILARMAFGTELSSTFPCAGITKVTFEDTRYAKQKGCVIRLIASAGYVGRGFGGFVSPCLLPASHPLAGVNGVNNAILLQCNMAGEVMFYGAGAGKYPTASAVVSDIVEICTQSEPRIVFNSHSRRDMVSSESDFEEFKLYVRVRTKNRRLSEKHAKQLIGDVEIFEAEGEGFMDEFGIMTPKHIGIKAINAINDDVTSIGQAMPVFETT